VGVVLFERFELLDVFGPLELYRMLADRFELCLIGPSTGHERSAQGPGVLADCGYSAAPAPDIVLVPGGVGTRSLVEDRGLLDWRRGWAQGAELVTSV